MPSGQFTWDFSNRMAEGTQVYGGAGRAATGELLRELIIDPSRDYQPTGAPKGPTRRPSK